MATSITLVDNRFVVTGNAHIRRAAVELVGAGARKDGSVTLPANLLSFSELRSAFPKSLDDLQEWVLAELELTRLGAAINDRSLQAWSLPDMWEWQAQAVDRLLAGSVCLFDDRGMGKTRVVIEAIRASSRTEQVRAVVFTSKRVRAVWRASVGLWWQADRVVVPAARTWSEAVDQVGTADITILTYDSLLNDDIHAAVKALDPTWLVVDEAHNLKKRSRKDKDKDGKPKQKKTKSGLVRELPGKRRVVLTGTPMPNSWDEVWTLLNFVAPEVWTSYWQFVGVLGRVQESYWGGKTVSPHIVEKDLWQRVYDRWIISRERAHDGKVWDFVPVELSWVELKAYHQMETEMRSENEGQVLDASTRLGQLTRMQQLAGALGSWETFEKDGRIVSKFTHARPSSKTDTLLEMVEGLHRAVVFTRFRDRAEFVAGEILKAGIEPLLITGNTTEVATELALGRFADLRQGPFVMVCVYGTISEGVNELVAARDIFFLDWLTVKDVEQAADRLARPGQEFEVRCVTLYAEDTIDEAAVDREAGKMRPLREILRMPGGWSYLDDWKET